MATADSNSTQPIRDITKTFVQGQFDGGMSQVAQNIYGRSRGDSDFAKQLRRQNNPGFRTDEAGNFHFGQPFAANGSQPLKPRRVAAEAEPEAALIIPNGIPRHDVHSLAPPRQRRDLEQPEPGEDRAPRGHDRRHHDRRQQRRHGRDHFDSPAQDDQEDARKTRRKRAGAPETPDLRQDLKSKLDFLRHPPQEDRIRTDTRRERPAADDDSAAQQAYARASELAKARGADQVEDQDYANVPYYKTHLRPDERFPDQIEDPEKYMNGFLDKTKQRARALGTVGECGRGVREGANSTDPENTHLIGDPKNIGFYRTATELGELYQNLGWTKIALKDLTPSQRDNLPTALIVRPWSFNARGAGDISVKEHRGKQYNDHTQGFDYGSSRYAGTYALLPANHPYAVAHRLDFDTLVAREKNP
jgi:hypothetical protein